MTGLGETTPADPSGRSGSPAHAAGIDGPASPDPSIDPSDPSDSTPPARRAALGLGAVAGAAVVVGIFTWLSRPALPGDDLRRALERAFERGPAVGAWQIEESHGTRFRQFAPDPNDPERVVTYLRDPVHPSEKGDARGPEAAHHRVRVVSFPRSGVARRVFGEPSLDLLFENYRPKTLSEETVAGRRAVVVRFENAHAGVRGPTRTVWLDRETRDLLRVEDRTFDGVLVHGARRLSAEFLDGWRPPAEPVPRRGSEPPEEGREEPTLEAVVRAARFPVYEPRRLPPGFRRVSQAFQALPDPAPRRSPWDPPLRMGTVFVRYSDGLARLNFMMALAADMRRIQEIQRELARLVADPAACPSTAESPVQLLAGADDLIVRRRSDTCSTILQIDRLGGVSIVLSGRNEVPREVYEEAMASLAPAPGSVPPPEDDPIEVWRVGFSGRDDLPFSPPSEDD
jgi:hypothetical protein